MKSLEPITRCKFMKDLIIQILAMISEQERNESKRRQAQGFKSPKKKGIYRGDLFCILPMLKTHKSV